MKKTYVMLALVVVGVGAGCTAVGAGSADKSDNAVLSMMKSSFQAKGQATMDRLIQDDVQAVCSEAEGKPLPKEKAAAIEKHQLSMVKFPADGKFLGDFAAGEKIAQTGKGFQWNDKPGSVAGGNCYACHQLTKKEISFGNIGPSLYNYGKLRGSGEPIVKYTWAKLYNAKAFSACSSMPRFGHKGILTEQQLKDVMALLLDPKSPVNQ